MLIRWSRIREELARGGRWISCAVLLALALSAVRCSNTDVSGGFEDGIGTMRVSLTDPPSCVPPSGSFQSVFVTIRSVQAHVSSTADDNSSGWQELAPQLASQPVQLDLLNLPANGLCLLQQLGSNEIPAGNYQQFRLLLVPNGQAAGAVSTNHCEADLGGDVYNCVVDENGVTTALDLSSQANTGLKIPPGQIVGGPIHVGDGQTVDVNIDFNTCSSIVPAGNGFRLKPTLTASQVSANRSGISGQIVDDDTTQPVAGAMVAIEMQDDAGIDRIFMQTQTDSNGQFRFCPLPDGVAFDLVATALAGGVAYNATVVLNVPNGTSLGAIPIIPETGSSSGPGTIQGVVTARENSSGAEVDAAISALQAAPLPGGGTRQVTIPLLPGSEASLSVSSSSSCPPSAPVGAFCAQYTLIVPASNPSVGAFSAGSVTFDPPAGGDVLYSVEAQTFQPLSGGEAICSPSAQTTDVDETAQPLAVTPGATVTAERLDFSGCS